MEGYKYVYNDPNTKLLVNEDGLFYDERLKRFRDAKYLIGRGYKRVSINGEYHLAHRAVKITFNPIDKPELYDVHHIDENKTNNKLSNLQYIEKGKHSKQHNTGSGNGRAKLTEEQAKNIKYDLAGLPYNIVFKEMKDLYGISITKDILYKIRSGKTWKNI